MTVYVVTDGEYSDYHIVGIFSDREKAEICVAIKTEDGGVEEWDVDDIKIDSNLKLIDYAIIHYVPFVKKPFCGIAMKKGLEGRIDFSKHLELFSGHQYFIVRADTEEKAKKIFYDEYTKAISEYLIEQGGGAE
ncbi:MAG: hypothetical protein IJ880_17455 [Bacilli bacterium]|nr:hypothetical protein [Bacilli bacterium]